MQFRNYRLLWERRKSRAFAFRAWLLSGMGYLRSFGSPNSLLGSAFFFDVVSFAIPFLPSQVEHAKFLCNVAAIGEHIALVPSADTNS